MYSEIASAALLLLGMGLFLFAAWTLRGGDFVLGVVALAAGVLALKFSTDFARIAAFSRRIDR